MRKPIPQPPPPQNAPPPEPPPLPSSDATGSAARSPAPVPAPPPPQPPQAKNISAPLEPPTPLKPPTPVTPTETLQAPIAPTPIAPTPIAPTPIAPTPNPAEAPATPIATLPAPGSVPALSKPRAGTQPTQPAQISDNDAPTTTSPSPGALPPPPDAPPGPPAPPLWRKLFVTGATAVSALALHMMRFWSVLQDQRRRWRWSFICMVAAISAVAFCVTLFWNALQDRLPWQKKITLQAYSRLMAGLDSLHEHNDDVETGDPNKIKGLETLVIHTGGVRQITPPPIIKGEEPKPYTDRIELSRLIEQIAKMKPEAIGVDFDFSPPGDWAISKDDPQFLVKMREISEREKVPVYLGVYRRRQSKNGNYFGLGVNNESENNQFDPLAAAIPVAPRNTVYIPLVSVSKNGKKRLRSLAYKMAFGDEADYHARKPRPQKRKPPLADKILVNYSPLDALRSSALLTITPETVKEYKGHIEGKYVLLGDAVQPRTVDDVFRIPGQKTPVPGVFLHACAIYTLLEEPVEEFPPALRFFLNLGGVVLIPFLVFIALRLHGKDEAHCYGTGEKFFARSAEATLLLGFLLIVIAKWFWFDFLFISGVFTLASVFFEWLPAPAPAPAPDPAVKNP